MNISSRTKRITKITLMTAFLIVASYIVVPLPFAVAAISMQTLAVNLLALLLLPAESGVSILIYMLLCAVGVPVANGGRGGLGYLLGPTGGFFVGFLVAVILISFLKGKRYNLWRYIFVMVCVGIPVIYIFAIGWMVCVTEMSVEAAFTTGCIPFLLADIVKCVAAGLFAKPLLKVMNQYEERDDRKDI